MLECLDTGNFCKGIPCCNCPFQFKNGDCNIDRIYQKVLAVETTPPKLSKGERKELVIKKYVKTCEDNQKVYLAEMKKIDEEKE